MFHTARPGHNPVICGLNTGIVGLNLGIFGLNSWDPMGSVVFTLGYVVLTLGKLWEKVNMP